MRPRAEIERAVNEWPRGTALQQLAREEALLEVALDLRDMLAVLTRPYAVHPVGSKED